ncbi:MAG: hypothetical protein WBY24_17230 [Candidatus Acidiferrales bacterium]
MKRSCMKRNRMNMNRMKTRSAFLALAGAMLVLLTLSASARAQDAPPPPPPNAVWAHGGEGPGPMMREGIGFLGFEAGLGEKTVTGAPFSATFSTQSTQTLADGNQIQHSSTGTIARDSQGRTRRDMTLPAIGSFAVVSGQSASHVVFLNDPVAGTRFVLEEDKKLAQQMPEPPNRSEFAERGSPKDGPRGASRNDAEVTTSLGAQTIGGVSAEGTRYTRTIPVGEIGNTKPIVIVTERWYSPDLQMVVMTKRSDPRSGETTFQMTNIQREEPAATLFQVPAGYTVTQGPARGHAHGHMGGPQPPPEQ